MIIETASIDFVPEHIGAVDRDNDPPGAKDSGVYIYLDGRMLTLWDDEAQSFLMQWDKFKALHKEG